MQIKITQGIWRAYKETDYVPAQVFADDYGRPIADVFGEDRETRKANAQAIAAVPELIAALQAIQARIAGEWDNPALVAYGPLSPNSINDIKIMCANALAKAGR